MPGRSVLVVDVTDTERCEAAAALGAVGGLVTDAGYTSAGQEVDAMARPPAGAITADKSATIRATATTQGVDTPRAPSAQLVRFPDDPGLS